MRLCWPNLQTAKVPLSESRHSHKRLSVLICQPRWKDLRSSSWELYPEDSEFKLRGDGGDTSVSQSALQRDGGDPNRMLSSPQGHFSPLKFPHTYNSTAVLSISTENTWLSRVITGHHARVATDSLILSVSLVRRSSCTAVWLITYIRDGL